MRNHIVAIIYPDPDETKLFCKDLGGSDTESHAERIKRPELIKKIETDLAVLAKNNNFNSLEKVKDNFELVADPFKEGEVLTPTLKLKRKPARDSYKDEIALIYRRADAAIHV